MIRPTAQTAIRPAIRVQDRNVIRVGGLAVLASLSSFFYYAQRGEILMHGDATAHINIARRVFDSLTPGPLQLGTVWLPLPHLLMMPFIYPNKLWQSGAGGSIPSLVAYVLGVLGIVRLVGGLLESDERTRPLAYLGAWLAAFAYGANPNLIYMQSTALTEPLYLAFFIWTLVYFTEFLREIETSGAAGETPGRSIRRCAYCVACAEMTRYDGWFLAGVVGAMMVVIALRRWQDRALRWRALKFLVGIAIAPALWLIYNAAVYGNALDFANGPYSAKAIELRVAAPNLAFHNLWLGGLYFLKSAQITLAVGNWGRLWLAGAVAATLLAGWLLRTRALPLLVGLWAPLAFYAYSLSYGWVPVHVPMWWPFAVFNQRFGLELLPMFAVSAGLLAAIVPVLTREAPAWSATAAAVVLIVASYAFVLRAQPLCLVEAQRNWEMRRGLDTSVERVVKTLPRDSQFLMDLGEHVGIMERLGIPLRRVVNSENRRPWKRPTDPEGIWERTLADPGAYVDYVIAFDGDPVARGVNRANLNLLTVIHSTGQPVARIYETPRATNQSR
jgi:hypothetical protein